MGMCRQAFVPRVRACGESVASGPRRLLRHVAGKRGRMIHVFSGVQTNNYWSSTANATNPDNAHNVNLNNGNTNDNTKTNTNFVWPVRGGE
jgi:hypothetical protein